VNHNHNKDVPRPVRPTDALVILTEFLYNISQVVATLFESLMELSIYHSNRQTKLNKVWDEFAQDLETIQEDTDGA
jgi:hypothetical protein